MLWTFQKKEKKYRKKMLTGLDGGVWVEKHERGGAMERHNLGGEL